ncbi:outer membrane beta-barrel protein [bacterium]|nr:outer membrane beta-barrel protein [candidate division CSSED10-310 bacterium]
MTRRFFIVCLILIVPGISSQAYEWYASFDAGNSIPTESFDSVADDEYVYGLSIDYVPNQHLGVRVAYYHQEFQCDSPEMDYRIQIESLGVWAIIDYPFPKYFRLFALVGPTYFSSQHDRNVIAWDNSDDIGWSAGGGIDFQPFSGWGFRFQSIYNSGLFGDNNPRASWVNSTFGMSFKF